MEVLCMKVRLGKLIAVIYIMIILVILTFVTYLKNNSFTRATETFYSIINLKINTILLIALLMNDRNYTRILKFSSYSFDYL